MSQRNRQKREMNRQRKELEAQDSRMFKGLRRSGTKRKRSKTHSGRHRLIAAGATIIVAAGSVGIGLSVSHGSKSSSANGVSILPTQGLPNEKFVQTSYQVGVAFLHDISSISATETVVSQRLGKGDLVFNFLDGFTNTGNWYQIGTSQERDVSYYANKTRLGSTSGYGFTAEAFNNHGVQTYPPGNGVGETLGVVKPGDRVRLSLSIGNNEVIGNETDLDNGKNAGFRLPDPGVSTFLGIINNGGGSGATTSMMTEVHQSEDSPIPLRPTFYKIDSAGGAGEGGGFIYKLGLNTISAVVGTPLGGAREIFSGNRNEVAYDNLSVVYLQQKGVIITGAPDPVKRLLRQ